MEKRTAVLSGIGYLDRILGGLYIGDNVVWHDDTGSLSWVFCFNFIQVSQSQAKALVYVTFDRSPKNLLDKLGPLGRYSQLTILDCFTYGKGQGAPTFLKFYDRQSGDLQCSLTSVRHPEDIEAFQDALYELLGNLEGDVRFVFESVTGMQDLWGGEEQFVRFYSHACPRLYELDTIAYWILEKKIHSAKALAQINQIAQVAVELSIKRGTTTLTILKADNREPEHLGKPIVYWSREFVLSFEEEGSGAGPINLGPRLKRMRSAAGISQSELAKLVGVTPSTVSQVESNLIHPSLPALYRMAEVLGVPVSRFFAEDPKPDHSIIFREADATVLQFSHVPPDHVTVRLLTPMDSPFKGEAYLIELAAGAGVHTHFLTGISEQCGYLTRGRLEVDTQAGRSVLEPGDLIYFHSQMPSGWRNVGVEPARLLWFRIRS